MAIAIVVEKCYNASNNFLKIWISKPLVKNWWLLYENPNVNHWETSTILVLNRQEKIFKQINSHSFPLNDPEMRNRTRFHSGLLAWRTDRERGKEDSDWRGVTVAGGVLLLGRNRPCGFGLGMSVGGGTNRVPTRTARVKVRAGYSLFWANPMDVWSNQTPNRPAWRNVRNRRTRSKVALVCLNKYFFFFSVNRFQFAPCVAIV